jgi:hypothetical protein
MTAATETTTFDRVPMAQYHKVLTISDGNTYVSDIAHPIGCHITEAEDMGDETHATSYALSGRTFTFHADGVSSKKIFITVYGRQ